MSSSPADTWSLRSLVRAGLANWMSLGFRTIAVSVLGALFVAAAAGSAGVRTAERVKFSDDLRLQGRQILGVLDPTDTINRTKCEQLSLRSTILGSGSMTRTSTIEALTHPTQLYLQLEVTGGMIDVMFPTSQFVSPTEMDGVVASAEAASALSLRRDSRIATSDGPLIVTDISPPPVRFDSASRAVLSLTAAFGSAQECWVEVAPQSIETWRSALSTAVAAPEAEVILLLPIDAGARNVRDEQAAEQRLLTSGLMAVLLVTVHMLLWRSRRQEIGLYCALGASRPQVAVMLFTEGLANLAVAIGLGLPVALFGLEMAQPESAAHGVATVVSVAVISVSLAVVGLAAASLGVGRSSVLDMLKDR